MSRRICCDNCQEELPWLDGDNINAKRLNKERRAKPPLTARGQGYALDFCGPECLGEWGLAEAERLEEEAVRREESATRP